MRKANIKDAGMRGMNVRKAGLYERKVKPALDKGLSFAGLILLSPIFVIISIAIIIDDPGPVFFTQKRIGKNKTYFMCHKFRSMKRKTPHDVPTHLLKRPERYITRVGKFLRKTSLDELPQIWDIFRGKMSIIGPRPALWNQDDLVAEREKYGANDILPGLTGWAQINGRDELEIAEKARLDGIYVKKLKQGGLRALFFDVKCFCGTIFSVLGSDGVVEGGTGELKRRGSARSGESPDSILNEAENKVNLHAPGWGRTTTHESVAGAFGIPELMPPNRRRTFKVNPHAPGCGRTTTHESMWRAHLASLNSDRLRRWTFIVKSEGCGYSANPGIKSNFKYKDSENKGTVDTENAGFKDYGYLKNFNIDISENNKKHILVTGAGSYIGESFERWAKEHYRENFTIDTLDMQKSDWRETDFSVYDAVFHVAGIAHADVGKVSKEEKKKYYAVNTDLAIEAAKKAKAEGVKQFVFMSSMIIYGDSGPYGKEKVIDETTAPAPSNFYGDSKWQADRGIRALADRTFRVAVLRSPMIYGKGSKGNYSVLARLAKTLPVFPDVENKRSVLYIGNLCEFLCKLMLSGEGGIYFPQNREYAKTSEMARKIAEADRRKIWVTKLLRPAIALGSLVPGEISGLVNKAFGNSAYDQRLSEYEGLAYQHIDLKTSIAYMATGDFEYRKPEEEKRISKQKPKKRILILVNHDVVIYNFRLELVERLLDEGYEVHISSPTGEHTQELIVLGVHFHKICIDRHGMNPKVELQVLLEYRRLIKTIHPTVILTYTVKPNVYGGIAAQMAHIPFVANITGLGTTLNRERVKAGIWEEIREGIKEGIVLVLYRLGLRRAQKVFFQNKSNRDFMLKRHTFSDGCPTEVLPGSGVNLDTHNFEPYPEDTERIIFTTVGRIMHDKGTDELLWAATEIRKKYPAVVFRLIGFFDEDYETKIRRAVEMGIIEYVEQQRDIHPWMREAHAILHPSYHEGMSNVLLEAAATGRPVLASDIPGCREAFDEGVSGLGFGPHNVRELVGTIEKFIRLPYEQKRAMGKAGRKKMEREFGRDIVVDKYMEEIYKISANCEREEYEYI